MSEQHYQQALTLTEDGHYHAAAEQLKTILEAAEQDLLYFKSLKLYSDIVGPLTGSDHLLAIDMYQKIINECEDDDLFESAQLAQLSSYLNMSISLMETYENTLDVIDNTAAKTQHYLANLQQKRERFITARAEAIYKSRL